MSCRRHHLHDQAAIVISRTERIRLIIMKPAATTAPASTINPTGIVAYDVVTVAQSMHTAAESNDSWLAELQIEQQVFIDSLLDVDDYILQLDLKG